MQACRLLRHSLIAVSAGLMPTEARGNYLPEPPYLRETKIYITASHSSRYDVVAIISSRYQYGPFLFCCCRSYVKLLRA